MSEQTSDLTALENGALADIEQAGDFNALEQLRVGLLGKKGSVSELMKTPCR
jgi:phenylalanyl-tRNA synthetase alpha chain